MYNAGAGVKEKDAEKDKNRKVPFLGLDETYNYIYGSVLKVFLVII